MRSSSALRGAFLFSLAFASARSARAAGPWVDRKITLPRHDWAFDFGLGVAHAPGWTGPGINFEVAGAVTREVQLGLRTGFRFDQRGRGEAPDVYGRPFDTETYGTGVDTVANPEFYVRALLIEGSVVELGIEGRVMSPFSQGLGLMAGMPLAFHFGRDARLDTGVYMPVLFHDPTRSFLSFPFHFWFQATDRFWLGPMSGVRLQTSNGSGTSVPLGLGLGYSMTHNADFKAQFLFQDVANGPAERYGGGIGFEVRIE